MGDTVNNVDIDFCGSSAPSAWDNIKANLEDVVEKLKKNNGNTSKTCILSEEIFDRTMVLSKYYSDGLQFIKRNRRSAKKKNRYIKTFINRKMRIISDDCMECCGIKYYKSSFLIQVNKVCLV